MGLLTQRVHDRLDASQWKCVRDFFLPVAEIILGASPDARGVLAGNYVKFATGLDPTRPAYAAAWPRVSLPKRLIVGLALPEDFEAEPLGPCPERIFYRGLTKFLVLPEGQSIPEGLSRPRDC
ncbi:MAG: hypothetical protein NTW96_25575 [Planctomycetia bacterium]|nr:hypothetical protein [Planctomycetia bacterium]